MRRKFVKSLLDEYRPPAITDNFGGFVIPKILLTDSPGKIASFWRWLGIFTCSVWIYKLGTHYYNVYEAILGIVAEK